MKKITMIVVALMVAAFVSATVFAADTYEYKGGAMGKVSFNHKKHQETEKDCKICHHKDEAGKEGNCTKCHSKDSQVKAKDAYHNNCMKCHKDKKKGPTGCKDCHKK